MSALWRLLWQPFWDGYAMRYWLHCKQDQLEG